MNKPMGKQSLKFDENVYILEGASIVGKKEGEGPLKDYFDEIVNDAYFGGSSWEEAEANLQKIAVCKVLKKSGLKKEDIRYIFSGDLLNQLIATSFGLEDFNIPVFGLYGACSTMGEAISIGSVMISSGGGENVLAMASSHFGSAEKNYRFPLEYGSQRPYSATWTVTGSGCVILSKNKGIAKIKGITTGKITDFGVKDSMNMGASMAPAAVNVIYHNLKDFNYQANEYDKIITGDLGTIGKRIVIELLMAKGIDVSNNYMDCGIEIYNSKEQDTNAGGSGCGCSASVLCGYILDKLRKKEWKKILFIPTGAMLSTVSFNEGNSVPGIAHGVIIEAIDEKL